MRHNAHTCTLQYMYRNLPCDIFSSPKIYNKCKYPIYLTDLIILYTVSRKKENNSILNTTQLIQTCYCNIFFAIFIQQFLQFCIPHTFASVVYAVLFILFILFYFIFLLCFVTSVFLLPYMANKDIYYIGLLETVQLKLETKLMTTSSQCDTGRTCLSLPIITRENTSLAIHVVQKITIICVQKIGKFVVWNLILCTGAIGRRIEQEGWLSPTERASAG